MKYFTKENKRNRLLSSKISIIVIMTAATLMITSTMITGAYAAPTRKVQGQGTGTLTCGDGTFHTNSILNFEAQPTSKSPGPSQKLFGNWGIVSKIDDAARTVTGNIYSGKISKADFSLLSTISRAGQGICDNDPSPSKGTITGHCGLEVKVNLQFETGAHGTFTGNVVCFG
ncbi:MAG: hypothetical protein WA421_18740 [Nitrososphaeraceae archaeon]